MYAPTLLILGPVALRDQAGADVPLGGALPRRLLTGLALRAGELLSPDTLADIVWGEYLPRSARHNLNTYLWSLRRVLERAGGQVTIEARTGGYLLSAGPGALDWHCFRDLAREAAGMAPDDPAAAEELLRQALGLWRGGAGAELDGGPPSVAARITGMNEARLAAQEQRIEAGLAAGRHRELAGELAELTAADPLRENVHAQLMVALYRSGRRADALATFQRLHRNLAGELGVDPSPPLIALHEAILRAQPLAGWPLAQPGATDGSTALVRLAASVRDTTLGQRTEAEEARLFQGRAAELARMRDLLADVSRLPRVVELHGPPGIGKTAFAYALARECGSRGWPAVILDSRDFGHDPVVLSQTVAARCGATRAPARDRPLLLVLDTAEEMRDIEHDLWEHILPGLSGAVLVMLCGRRPTPALARSAGWRGLVDQIELPALSQAESRRLVSSLGVRDPASMDSILVFWARQSAVPYGGRAVRLVGWRLLIRRADGRAWPNRAW
jgi:SARP family transcriptional regulator, regulator of embCAB operon